MDAIQGQKLDSLIRTLVRDLRPVRPVRISRVFAVCLGVEVGAGVLAGYVLGVRADIVARLSQPTFISILVVLALAAAGCCSVAVQLAMPGRDLRLRRGWLLLLVLSPLLLSAAVVVMAPWGGQWPGLDHLMAGCWHCVPRTLAIAAVPWVVTVLALRNLAPLREVKVGLFAALSAFLVGALVLQLNCPIDQRYHLALAHYLPVALFSGVTCVLAALILHVRGHEADLPSEQGE